MVKDQRNLRIRLKTLITSYITTLMWWVGILAQFLWNWENLLINVGPVEVHIINVSALTALDLLPEEEKKKPENFERLTRSSISPI